jgi:TonB family protein
MNQLDFDELLFEDRNKDYGAFFLRKNYNKNLIISMVISLLFCCSIVIIPFFIIQGKIYRDGDPGGFKNVSLTAEHLDFPEEKLSSKRYAEMMSIKPEIVDDKSSRNIVNKEEKDQIFQYEESNNTSDHIVLESRPSFQGGDIEKFSIWVATHLNYPEEAFKNKIQGAFKIIFVIEKDGSVSNVKVESNPERSIEREIKRVVTSSPKWSPGILKGRPVRVQCEITLILKIK